jgi:DNA polymerase-3 subunit beta
LDGFLKAAKAEKIILSLASPNSLAIEAAGATTVLHGFEAKDFPSVPGVRGAPTVVIGLASALKEIIYAMAKEDSRPVLAGVCFTPKDGKIALAAADGFRLAETTVNAKGNLERMIVPSKAICLIQKLMPGKVSIHKSGDNIAFIGDGLVLTTHAVQGTYPNYEQIIPKNGLPLTLESQALRDALDVVSVTLGDNNIVRLEKKGTNLIVSTQDEEKGETEAKVPAKGKGKIAFQMNYIKESLARLDGRISLRITDPNTPGVVKQGRTIHVLMPMFVQW